MRMNREILNTTKYRVSSNCANYNSNETCDGVMIGGKLQQWIDSEKQGKKCLVLNGKQCDYFNRCIKPLAK